MLENPQGVQVRAALVGIEKTAYHFDMPYTYLIPEELVKVCQPGCRVMVNFGNSVKNRRQGIVLDVTTVQPDGKYKPILAVLDETPLLSSEMISLTKWLREMTFCTYFEAARTLFPAGINLKIKVSYAASPDIHDDGGLDDRQRLLFSYLKDKKVFVESEKLYSALGFEKDCGIAEGLADKGLLIKDYGTAAGVGDATVKSVRIADSAFFGTLTPKQQAVFDLLCETGTMSVREACYYTGVGAGVISTLEKRGAVEIFDEPVYRSPKITEGAGSMPENLVLTDEQRIAYEGLLSSYQSGKGETSLLFGVTGSGKTGVFMKLIDRAVEDGKGVIVMVPEISLTPQVLSKFKSRYGKKIAVFHSGLSVGERRDEYLRVKKGEAQIAIGTRSAVFAPFDNLGLIVIDEEQEGTYKSEMSPRYDARQVARFRCAWNKALLVLSSATPSVESYTYAMKGIYGIQTIKNRYGSAKLPEVITVDLRADRAEGNRYDISSVLLKELEDNLNSGRQSILLINRRGYNTFLACNSCGHVLTCPSCSISLTYHHANKRMMCHYCGYSAPVETVCPECGKNDIRYSGYGTQKIEDELRELLPDARVLRMDTDTTLSRFSHESKLAAFEAGEYDILLGTQMVAKGLDFANVTLVGVVSADQQLNNDDFRSMERTFDLLTQVVGRAGRGDAAGRAVIQTLTPENSVLRLAARQDYEAFYKNEIEIRRFLKYPPFCDICTVTFISEDEGKASLCSKLFLKRISEYCTGEYKDIKLIILGPMPPRVAKISDKFRFRLIIKCKNGKDFRSMMSALLTEYGKKREFSDVTVVADMNPTAII